MFIKIIKPTHKAYIPLHRVYAIFKEEDKITVEYESQMGEKKAYTITKAEDGEELFGDIVSDLEQFL